jgi:nicotinate-nucleotide pyrophosphorylase (carboxylating)
MSGIATATRAYVEAVAGTGVEILDTRKTAPGLRALDKRAVACGGGRNHRMGLDDAILIKDNHVAIAGGIIPAVEAARAANPGLAVEVEVDDLGQLDAAIAAGADTILLDNMHPARLREAVARTGGRARLEASGGITLDTVRAVAETGVDAISIGALTHSVTALDVSLEVHPWQS